MREIPLTKGLRAIVDDRDYERLIVLQWRAKWNRNARAWLPLCVSAPFRLKPMYQIILGIKPGREIDHKNGDTLDNRRHNLRFATRSQNACNRRKCAGTQYPIKGVFRNIQGRYTVRLVIQGRRRSVGTFRRLSDAAAAYDAAAQQFYGAFARLNQPLESEG